MAKSFWLRTKLNFVMFLPHLFAFCCMVSWYPIEMSSYAFRVKCGKRLHFVCGDDDEKWKTVESFCALFRKNLRVEFEKISCGRRWKFSKHKLPLQVRYAPKCTISHIISYDVRLSTREVWFNFTVDNLGKEICSTSSKFVHKITDNGIMASLENF